MKAKFVDQITVRDKTARRQVPAFALFAVVRVPSTSTAFATLVTLSLERHARGPHRALPFSAKVARRQEPVARDRRQECKRRLDRAVCRAAPVLAPLAQTQSQKVKRHPACIFPRREACTVVEEPTKPWGAEYADTKGRRDVAFYTHFLLPLLAQG